MKNLMSKKVKVFGRDVSVLLIAVVAIMGFGAALLISQFGSVLTTADVNQGLFLDGNKWDVPVLESLTATSLAASEERTDHVLNNNASVAALFSLSSDCTTTATDCVGLHTSFEYLLDSVGVCPGDTCEDRVVVSAAEAGVTTLGALDSISWDAIVSLGYLPHVDVVIDTDGDGVRDDVLVFEWAKVNDTDCHDSTSGSPTGEVDTLGSGALGGDSWAWLGSGPAGGCSSPSDVFFWHSLDAWKSGPPTTEANGKTVNSATTVLAFEFEVDNWVVNSEATLTGIEIDSTPVEASYLGAGQTLDFNIVYMFEQLLEPGTYTIETTVDA
jgi:hypothetical protein